MNMALSCPRCGRREAVQPRQADFGVPCPECYEFMDVERSRSSGRGRVPEDVRPWTPMQIVASALGFGAGACGTVAGINFARLGKRQYLIPCFVAGWALFGAVVWLVMVLVPDGTERPAAMLANLAIGVGFMLMQKPSFDVWKAVNWSPRPDDPYRPNGRGQLLLMCLVSATIELGVIYLLASVGNTR